MSASCLSSSGGPRIASRSWRLTSDICWVAVVIVRSGASTRPATTQPSAPEMIAMIASAMLDSITSWCRSEIRCPDCTLRITRWPDGDFSSLWSGGGSVADRCGARVALGWTGRKLPDGGCRNAGLAADADRSERLVA